MKKYFFTIVFLSLIFFVPVFSYADSAGSRVSKANRLFRSSKLDDALKTYHEALAKQPESPVINFNIGDVLYKKKDYQGAVEAFSKALLSPDSKLEADANYNIGNCKYKMGKLKEPADLSGAVNLYREALDYYKRTIELDQTNKDARYNHELVEKQLKLLLDKIKQQPPQDKQSPQNDKEKKEATGENQEQNQPQKQADAKPAGEEADKDSEQKVSQEEENKDEMSEEEARMILERYNQGDLSSGDLNRPQRTGNYPQVLKDW